MSGGVVNGQAVDEAITDAAFLFKNANDTSLVVYTLAAPTSGPQVDDIQNSINVLINGVGGDQSTAATAYSNVPSNTVAQGDTLNVAVSKLARKFYGLSASGGHTHSGVDGEGALVIAVQSLAASGSVQSASGAVTLSGGPFITIAQDTATDINIGFGSYGLPDVLAVNNSASAGFDMTGGAIVDLSYTDWINAAGFPPGTPATGHSYFAASGDGYFYKKNDAGTVTRIEGTIAASGQSAIYGDAILVAGSGTTLSQSGQNITISSAGSAASGSVSVFGSRASPIAVPASGITFTGTNPLNVIFVIGSGGAVAVTGSTSIVNSSAFTGQQLQIISTNATSTLTLSDSATGVNLRGEWVGDNIAGLTVVYDATNWYEMGRR